jgi:hypothetical protein
MTLAFVAYATLAGAAGTAVHIQQYLAFESAAIIITTREWDNY